MPDGLVTGPEALARCGLNMKAAIRLQAVLATMIEVISFI